MLNLTVGAIKFQVPFLDFCTPQTQLGLDQTASEHTFPVLSQCWTQPQTPHTVILTPQLFQTLARTALVSLTHS